jgi:hypothetical protein
MTGCVGGGGGGGGAKQAVEEFAPRLVKVFTNTSKFAIETHVQPGTGLTFTEDVDFGLSIKATLDKIASSDDPYGSALAAATCIGLGQLASHQNDPNAGPATNRPFRSSSTAPERPVFARAVSIQGPGGTFPLP